MPCYKPMTLYQSKAGPGPNGKTPLRGLINGGDPKKPVIVPCLKCIGCRLERSRQWAIRCVHEAQMHERNTFVTLTYNDEHLTYGGIGPILYPRDLQLFFKRLRKKYGPKIKYFACGEYGEKKGRPHYHACIFGVDFNHDRVQIPSRGEFPLYESKSLQELWSDDKGPIGRCQIGEVNFETAAYVARYIFKKKLGKSSEEYAKVGIHPEFTRMSRRPGIGTKFFERYTSDIFPSDQVVLRNGIKCRPPRYYGSKYEVLKPQEFAMIKERRKNEALKHAEDNTKIRLATKERISLSKIKQLIRRLE